MSDDVRELGKAMLYGGRFASDVLRAVVLEHRRSSFEPWLTSLASSKEHVPIDVLTAGCLAPTFQRLFHATFRILRSLNSRTE